jgi:hypothetical protein
VRKKMAPEKIHVRVSSSGGIWQANETQDDAIAYIRADIVSDAMINIIKQLEGVDKTLQEIRELWRNYR